MNPSKNILNVRGMTLMEVMVALGVASVMMVGIMQFVMDSQRTIKTMSQQSEWLNQVAILRLSIANPNRCQTMFTSTLLTGTANPTFSASATEASPINVDELKYGTASGGATLMKSGVTTREIKVTKLSLYDSGTPAVTRVINVSGSNYNFKEYIAVLKLNAEKDMGFVKAFGFKGLPEQKIEFKMLTYDSTGPFPTGAGANQIARCEGSLDQTFCLSLGGVYDGAANPQCRLPSVGLLGASLGVGTTDFGLPSPSTAVAGQRIRLSGANAPDHAGGATDFAMGMARSGTQDEFWISLNSATSASKVYAGPGTLTARRAMEIVVSNGTDNYALASLSNQGDLYLGAASGASTTPSPRLVLYGSNSLTAASADVYITSNRSAGSLGSTGTGTGAGSVRDQYSDESNQYGMDLHTGQKSRLRLSSDGLVKIGPDDITDTTDPYYGNSIVMGYPAESHTAVGSYGHIDTSYINYNPSTLDMTVNARDRLYMRGNTVMMEANHGTATSAVLLFKAGGVTAMGMRSTYVDVNSAVDFRLNGVKDAPVLRTDSSGNVAPAVNPYSNCNWSGYHLDNSAGSITSSGPLKLYPNSPMTSASSVTNRWVISASVACSTDYLGAWDTSSSTYLDNMVAPNLSTPIFISGAPRGWASRCPNSAKSMYVVLMQCDWN